jgi:hypothetical protein
MLLQLATAKSDEWSAWKDMAMVPVPLEHWMSDSTSVSWMEHIVNGLKPGQLAKFRVQAINDAGKSAFSSEQRMFTSVLRPGSMQPPSLMAPPATSSLRLRWEPPEETGGEGALGLRYVLERGGMEDMSIQKVGSAHGACVRDLVLLTPVAA